MSQSCRRGGCGSGVSGTCSISHVVVLGAGRPGGIDSATIGSVSFRRGGGGGVSDKLQDVGDRGWEFDGGAIARYTGLHIDA